MEALLWMGVAVAGMAVFLLFGPRTFPASGIDLRVTRDEAEQIAAGYLHARGFDLDGYRSAVLFETDVSASVYLQRELGLEEADALAAGGVPLYWWSVRWFRPLETKEYRVAVLPGGQVAGFERRIGETEEGASLEREEALAIAEQLLRERHPEPSAWKEVEARAERRDRRVDHTFTWEKEGFEAGEARLRVTVVVQGSEPGEYREYVKVPEDFERFYALEHSRSGLAAIIAGFLVTLVLAIAAFVWFLRAYREGQLSWRLAGSAAVLVLALSAVALVNQLPALPYRYETQIPYGVFIGTMVTLMAVFALAFGLWILLSGGAGEFLAQRHYPGTLDTMHDLIHGRFTRKLAVSSMRGYALAFGLLGYVTVFYWIGQACFGFWVPAEAPHVSAMNTRAPFLYPLLVGVAAAVSEEFAYRLFAIAFFRQFLRNTFIILLIPAVIWAFAHGSYGISPVYARGIELTIAGLVFGYCFIRHDLWTVIIAHYVFDAFIVGLPLLKSSSAYYQLSGLAVILLGLVPVLLAVPRLIPRHAVERTDAKGDAPA